VNKDVIIIDKRNVSMRMSDIKSAVIPSVYLCICPVTDISATVSQSAWNFAWWYRSRTQSLPFWGPYPQRGPNCNREYLKNGKSQRYMSIRA